MIDSEPTLTAPLRTLESQQPPLLGLTILWHPETERIGQQFIDTSHDGVIELSRFTPLFRHAGQHAMGTSLGHRCITRAPVTIRSSADQSVTVSAPDSRMTLEINGRQLTGSVTLALTQIQNGVVLGLGGLILVCIHRFRCLPKDNALPNLLGVSSAMITVRDLIRQVAPTSLPVLLLGETGTGKEMAAQAIHDVSVRRGQPFIAVNMATLNETLAAADLFGAAKGAYTGAHAARAGLFAEAGGGTLLLDEIGDTPAAIQAMLLRVLETGEYRPLGTHRNQLSYARLITATDQILEGRAFNQALLRRMEAFVICLPALRHRREDLGVLIVHFLQEWTKQCGQSIALPARFISELCNENWPGNVRQLAHVVRRAAIAVRAGEIPVLASFIEPKDDDKRIDSSAPQAADEISPALPDAPHLSAKPRKPKPSDLSPQDIIRAMENNAWQILGAAQQLGISRPTLYKLLSVHPTIRSLALIPPEEIEHALQEHNGDISRCASSLQTPSEALRRHLQTRR